MKNLHTFTRVSVSLKSVRNGAFTLSEILIALTIIGIVAVLTVPALIGENSSKAYQTKFKATFSQFQQGLTNTAAIKKQPFVKVDNTTGGSYHLEDYIKSNFSAKKVERTITPANAKSKTFKLKNGAHLIFPEATLTIMNNTGCSGNISTPCSIYIDVNGTNGPNETIECTSGTTSANLSATCSVAENITSDVFTVTIKNDRIFPATNAVDFVLKK